MALCHRWIRAASFRHSTRVTCSAIRSGLGAGTRSNRVKFSRACETVTAGVPPRSAAAPGSGTMSTLR